MKNTVCTALMLLMSVCMYAQELYGEYEKKVYVSSQGDSLKYRLLRPEAEKAGKKYPLVLFLHGAGERGDDNQKQLVHGGQMWLNPVNREEYPAFVLAPQCPKEDYWAYVGRPKSFVPGEMPEVQEPTRIFRTLKELLDTYLGKVPEKFTYNGVEYTPQSFAKSLGIKASDYVPLTSFTHHDFYKPFAIEVPDNWLWSEYYNIPLNELMETIDYAIDKGFTVMWASDVSEKGFQYLKGFAVVPVEKKNENLSGTELARWVKLSKSEKEGELYKFEEPEEEQYIDQKLRQEAFDNYETTDDHGMVFVGTAVDQNGTKYYKVKNSWGTEQIYGGFFYASEAFVKYKTMDILVHKDAVPVKILKKLHLK